MHLLFDAFYLEPRRVLEEELGFSANLGLRVLLFSALQELRFGFTSPPRSL